MTDALAQSAKDQEATLRTLRSAKCLEVKIWFSRLSVPKMDALSGDYDAELLDQGSTFANHVIRSAFLSRGKWVGKGFEPKDERSGVGYNTFGAGKKRVRKLPMRTEIRTSAIDDRESVTINYSHDNRGLICWLTGEVRQVTPNIMLGIGIYQIKLGRLEFQRRLIPFLLYRPVEELSLDAESNVSVRMNQSQATSFPRRAPSAA